MLDICENFLWYSIVGPYRMKQSGRVKQRTGSDHEGSKRCPTDRVVETRTIYTLNHLKSFLHHYRCAKTYSQKRPHLPQPLPREQEMFPSNITQFKTCRRPRLPRMVSGAKLIRPGSINGQKCRRPTSGKGTKIKHFIF